jgi:hypothetical protein
MSGSPAHSTHSQISPISPQDLPSINISQINQIPRRRASSPLLGGRNHPAILHQNHSSDSHSKLDSHDWEPQPVLMNDRIRMQIEVPKFLYANMLASLFTWLLLAGFIVLPATVTSIRNSRALDGMGRAGKAVIGATQNIPLLWVAGFCCVCGVSGLLWLWWGQNQNYIWLGDPIFL